MEHPPQADFLFKGQGEGREWTAAKTIQQFLRTKSEEKTYCFPQLANFGQLLSEKLWPRHAWQRGAAGWFLGEVYAICYHLENPGCNCMGKKNCCKGLVQQSSSVQFCLIISIGWTLLAEGELFSMPRPGHVSLPPPWAPHAPNSHPHHAVLCHPGVGVCPLPYQWPELTWAWWYMTQAMRGRGTRVLPGFGGGSRLPAAHADVGLCLTSEVSCTL